MSCNICFENINKSTRREITCPYCDFSSCLVCFKKYLLETSKAFPDCMSCRKDLQLEFIANETPKTFYNIEYRKKRANILLSQERSLLPDTQVLAEERREYFRKNEEKMKLKKELDELSKKMTEIRKKMNILSKNPIRTKEKERLQFTMACPGEDCRGFLSTAWKCGTCGLKACSKCLAIKNGEDDEKHECDENEVKTYEMMRKDTRPCPKCKVRIYKIDGCDQMWCVECKTPFSWKSGEIVKGTIHNPHFYEWQRQENNGNAPRVRGDNPGGCGELPWFDTILYILNERKHKFKNLANCHRLIGHLTDVILPMFPNNIGIQDNSDLRCKYLCNEISEEKWVCALGARLKKSEKNREVNQILEMFIVSITDLFVNYVSGFTMENLNKDAIALKKYANSELDKISYKYNNRVPYFDSSWNCTSC